MKQRPRNRDAGIVDEAGQRFPAERPLYTFRGMGHRGFIGDVEQKGRESRPEFLRQAGGVGFLAHAAEDVKAVLRENFHASPANPGRSAGDDGGFHR